MNLPQREPSGSGSDLQAVQPVPAVGGVADLEELQDSNKHLGVVVGQSAGQQAVGVIQLDVEAATQHISYSGLVGAPVMLVA